MVISSFQTIYINLKHIPNHTSWCYGIFYKLKRHFDIWHEGSGLTPACTRCTHYLTPILGIFPIFTVLSSIVPMAAVTVSSDNAGAGSFTA